MTGAGAEFKTPRTMEDDVAKKHPTAKRDNGNGFPDRPFFRDNASYRAAIVAELQLLPCRISSRNAVRAAAKELAALSQRLANDNPDADPQEHIAGLLIQLLAEDLLTGVGIDARTEMGDRGNG